MKYNTEKNVDEIKMLLRFIAGDAHEILVNISPQTDNDNLDCMWRLCEMIEDYADRARILIGKMSDEREDME